MIIMMARYQITGRVAGVPADTLVGLSDDQVRRRRSALKPAGDGLYLTLRSIEFKLGEVVSLDPSSLSKLQREMFSPIAETQPPVIEERASGRRRSG